MGQHCKLSEEKDPKIFSSVKRIVGYYVKAIEYIPSLLEDFKENVIYRKDVVKLPNEYKMSKKDCFVLKIGKYDIQDSSFWEDDQDTKKFCQNVPVECHIDKDGNIVNIYFVI